MERKLLERWKKTRARHSRWFEFHESASAVALHAREGRRCPAPWKGLRYLFQLCERWQTHLLPWREVPEAQGTELTHCCAA